jgi:hypothetical protein
VNRWQLLDGFLAGALDTFIAVLRWRMPILFAGAMGFVAWLTVS